MDFGKCLNSAGDFAAIPFCFSFDCFAHCDVLFFFFFFKFVCLLGRFFFLGGGGVLGINYGIVCMQILVNF